MARMDPNAHGILIVVALAAACRAPEASSPSSAQAAPSVEGPVQVVTERTEELTLPPELQHSPDPRAEAALRRHIESAQRGSPNYDEMGPGLAGAIRAQPGAIERVAQLGSIEAIAFKGKGPGGSDLFDVTTDRGVTRWTINLDSEGRTVGLFFRPGPPSAIPSEPELLQQIRAELDQSAASDTFSGVVLLAKDGKPILQEARGLADRERRVPVSMETKFRIGSMNKMFTAVAVLKLREAGKLALEDTLAKWLPDYPNAELARRVTLHHLLTHTGGTGDIFGPEFDARRSELLTHQDYVDLHGKRALAFEPGARFAYSNYGFVLLGRVIEKASGQSYYDYVEKHVLLPAGMTATSSPLESEAVDGRSVGYHGGPERRLSNADLLPPRATAAGGGLSTAGDMLRFAHALDSHTLLSAESTRLLMTRKVPMGPGLWYAYGFFEREGDGVHFVGHGGGFPGMNTDFKIFPESGHVLVVMANRDPPASGILAEFITARLPRSERQPAAAATPGRADGGTGAEPPPRGPNLIENGDLSAGAALWSTSLWPPLEAPKPVPSRVEAGALCASVRGGENVILGWPGDPATPKGFELTPGKRYRFSFRAWSSGPLPVRVVAKAGHQEFPYTAAVQAPVAVSPEQQVFALDFEPEQADAKAGVAFILSAPRGDGKNDVCVDDVALVGG